MGQEDLTKSGIRHAELTDYLVDFSEKISQVRTDTKWLISEVRDLKGNLPKESWIRRIVDEQITTRMHGIAKDVSSFKKKIQDNPGSLIASRWGRIDWPSVVKKSVWVGVSIGSGVAAYFAAKGGL